MDKQQQPELDKAQLYYAEVVHWTTIAACLIVLIAPVLILLFPQNCLMNPNLIFGAIFEGKKSADIWAAAGVPFKFGDFWPLLLNNVFDPDGFALLGVVLGCSVTLWALVPSVGVFFKRKEYFYTCVLVFIMIVIALAMSGIINMAG